MPWFIGGHQRLTVLKDLGYTEAQCVVLHIEDEAKVKALNIALNKISLLIAGFECLPRVVGRGAQLTERERLPLHFTHAESS